MAKTDKVQRSPGRIGPILGWTVGVALALSLGIAGWWYWGRTPPQMGPDEDVFRTVDALYTALRMRDSARVSRCAARLQSYFEAGNLPEEGFSYLADVVRRSQAGEWDPAIRSLYRFMRAQRRETAAIPSGPEHFG
ncbi:MAG TPA: hypothetical protein VIY86_15395 [Pirellulaceae bacterium]